MKMMMIRMTSLRATLAALLLLLALQFGFAHASSSADPYAVLHVPRNASQEDIRKSYKTLCLRYHPDKNIHVAADVRKQYEETFKDIQKAYSLIGDKDSRKNHDLLSRYAKPYGSFHQQQQNPYHPGHARARPSHHTDGRPRFTFTTDSIFHEMFKQYQQQQQQQQRNPFGSPSFGSSSGAAAGDFFNLSRFKSIYVQKVPVSLEDLYQGKRGHEFSLKATLWQRLTACFRGGYGIILLYQSLLFALPMMRLSKVLSATLGLYLFHNYIPEPTKTYFFADLKPGYKGGTKFTFTEDGFDAVFILKELEHPRFVRQGNDLYTIVYVNTRQAKRGATVSTTHLDGSKVEVHVPAGSKSGNLVRIAHQGWPDRKRGSRGDLYVHVLVKARTWR